MITRWTARRKAEIINNIAKGKITLKDACECYGLSLEEISEWRRKIASGGLFALRAEMHKRKVRGKIY